MWRSFFIGLLCLFAETCFSQKLISTGKNGYSETSVNTAVFRKNSIVTYRNEQYIAFYDENCYLTIGKRLLNSDQWTFCHSQYQGNCADAHNIISIMVDGEGFLHCAFNHHGSSLNYCKSICTGSLILGQKQSMTGNNESDVTYPEFYRLTNGDLIFVYRSGSSGNGNLVMNRYDLKTRKWKRVQNILIDGENQRNAYWQLYVDNTNTIHLSWVWRETPDVSSNHDLCYARSHDGGVSWEKSTGEKYRLPITAKNAEYVWHIPQNSELINQTSMCADSQGNPCIATYWRDSGSLVPQYRAVWFDSKRKRWEMKTIMQRNSPFSLSGSGTKKIPISRPQIIIDNKSSKGKIFLIFRDDERGNKVSLAIWNKDGNDLLIRDLTDFSVGAWEPTYDTELWREKNILHLFVQRSEQGDGEKKADIGPQPVYVLEVNK